MRYPLRVSASVLGLVLVLWGSADVQAAEVQVLAGGAMTAAIKQLGAQFESASGHKLVIRFGTTPELIKLATTGGPFDVGIVPQEVLRTPPRRLSSFPGRQPTSLASASASPSDRGLPSPR
jgi:molybdate transport system substrate-binding protein